MSFETCITALREELNLKYPITKNEKRKVNHDDRRLVLIHKIQLIVWNIMKNIANGQHPVFKSVAYATWKNCCFDGRVKLKETNRKVKVINFKRRNSRAEFTTIVLLLAKTHKLLMTQQTCTRRQLYYESVHLFKSQKQVDNGIREICNLLKASAWELRVLATSKGIVAGPLVLTLPGGELFDCGKPGGVCIPQNVLQIEEMSSPATWVLIVEKDACFQRLITARAANATLASCILITRMIAGDEKWIVRNNVPSTSVKANLHPKKGKGFPDVNSRILVCKFWEFLRIPILALVDADPYGFEIMCVYRFGSMSMSPHSEHLACPAVRWLGIHPGDIRPLLLESETLSFNDKRKLRLLLKRRYVEVNENLKTQLKILLEENAKAEIEEVARISTNYLTTVYMKNKIQRKEYL